MKAFLLKEDAMKAERHNKS